METYTCYHCHEKNEVEELVSDDHFSCFTCDETNYVVGTRTMDRDEYHESVCDSHDSVRYEEAAYGHDRDDFGPEYPTFSDNRWDD